ncbi:MAG TPA: Xaa-Pro peptidase family protein [Bryobacteraceae bacterium]|nr:Xaa-Pro peptidase family protein [Bryobacteraceae bacterium]
MRLLGLLSILAAALPVFGADASIPQDEYRQRRAALRKALPDSLIVLFGGTEGSDLRTGFFQSPDFYYLTGWREPNAILVITPDTEALLIPRRDAKQEQWTGRKLAPGDPTVQSESGFETVLPTTTFQSQLLKWAESASLIYTLTSSPQAEGLKRLLPLREIRNAALPIARLRAKKSAAEIALIQAATDATIEAHLAAWKRTKPGLGEYQIAATMSNAYFDRGCERHAYSPIVGSGKNAATLHYAENRKRMDEGELLLMDVGAECSMYATDITRTIPVNGKFTPRQKELYEVVLGAQKAAIDAIKPGVMLGHSSNKIGLHKIALDYIDSHGKDAKGQSLGRYFIHGLGHHVGLEVHDANDPAIPLEAGMVITIEPGIYLPEENIGIRIEDVVLVTETGAKVLSSSLPREVNEIEKAMAR